LKAGLVLALLGVFGLMLQSTVALWLPARSLPDLGLWIVVGLAVCLRSPVLGVCLAALIGYMTDLLSGTLLGQHVLLRLGAYGIARMLSSSFNLRGPLSLAVFALLLSTLHAVALHGLLAFFARQWLVASGSLQDLAVHALANAVAAPFVIALVSRVAARLGDDDSGRPVLLETRTLPL
jgi:cell shape-determining protein MreD